MREIHYSFTMSKFVAASTVQFCTLTVCLLCNPTNNEQRRQTCNRVTRIFFKLRLKKKLEKYSSIENFQRQYWQLHCFCRSLHPTSTLNICRHHLDSLSQSTTRQCLPRETRKSDTTENARIFYQHAEASKASEGVSCKGYCSHRDKDLWCR